MAWEQSDALHMGAMTHLAAGDMAGARRMALARRELPFFRQSDHLAVPWLIATAAMAGDLDEALDMAGRFRQSWIEAGRPTTGGIGMAPAAAAMALGLRGDEATRAEWIAIVAEMRRVVIALVGPRTGYGELFDGVVALHHGDLATAMARLAEPPESYVRWYDGAWRQWYAAVWAELAVVAGRPDRRDRLARATAIAAGNPVASAMVTRAVALDASDTDLLLAAAAALDEAGCPYQRARTLILAGGDARVTGEAILTSIGAAPMST